MRKLALVALIGVLAAPAASPALGGPAVCPASAVDDPLGRLAFLEGARLEVVDVGSCRVRTLLPRGASAPLRWSADGRYLGFGDGGVVASAGGRASYPLGRLSAGPASGAPGWTWSPSGHRLAGVSPSGAVLVGGPGVRPETLRPAGWGGTTVAFAPGGGSLAVSRSVFPRDAPPREQQVWIVTLPRGRARELVALPDGQVAPPWLFSFSPDGRWLVAWKDTGSSASIAADGLPLVAIPVGGGRPRPVGTGTLVDADFLSWCGDALASVVSPGGREVTLGSRIEFSRPPAWRTSAAGSAPGGQRLSFVSPACTSAGAIAAAVGPDTPDAPVGRERRRIWLLSRPGGVWRPLGPPPAAGSSDELPIWLAPGRVVAFVGTRWDAGTQRGAGRLYLLERGPSGASARQLGPVASVGSTQNDDGHYAWEGEVAWTAG